MPTCDAILPAGGKIDAEFAKEVVTDNKALVLINGKTLLGRAIDQLNATGKVRNMIVIGPDEIDKSDDGQRAIYKLPPGGSGPDYIYLGPKHLLNEPEPPSKVLIVTTDLPFITPGARLTIGHQIAISACWFATNFIWGALLVISYRPSWRRSRPSTAAGGWR